MATARSSRQFEFVLNELTRRMRRIYNRLFLAAGISAQQAAALIFLDRFGEQSQNELAERMELGKAAVAALLARMEDAGLVTRVAGPQDGRVRIVALTPSARELVERVNRLTADLQRGLRAGTTEEERRRTIAVLERMTVNIRLLEDTTLAGSDGPADRG